ncbi:MAG: M48 family metallopeptidase, partial [Acidobacteriota bacterium]|nr:M48 family metallopeptidase [Acidobacteriota bacterium]
AQTPATTTPTTRSVYSLPPETHEKAVAYSRARYRLHFAAAAWQVALLAGILALKIAPRFRDIAERVSRRRFIQALVFTPLVLGLVGLLTLPFDVWGHRLSVAYGQSVQGWGSWLADWLKGNLVGLVIAVPLVWMLYGILRRAPRRWWLWFWLASLPVIVFVVFLAPLVFDPLFFRFRPLESRAPELVVDIEKVTSRAGLEIPRDKMYVMEASAKRRSVNAYVTGLGASKRVVVWDTTLAKMTPPQTLFVFGHEMGHYVLGHVPKTIAFVAALLLVLLFLAHVVGRRLFREGEKPFGIRGLSDWASLPLLLLFLSIGSELSLPVVNAYSRTNEHAADVYGLEAIHGVVPDASRAAEEAFQVLGEINLSDPKPGPFVRFWLYSHPPIAERIAFARSYDPWSRGEPTRFVLPAPPVAP